MTLIALALAGCGGDAFQLGGPLRPDLDAAPYSPGSSDSPRSPDTEASSDIGPSFDSSSPETAPAVTPSADASSTRADASDAGDELVEACPAVGCLCVVVTPGYGCPAGFPYVARDAGVESCCNTP